MAIFDPNELNFNGEEIKNSAEAVFISAFAKPELNKFMEIVGGIVAKKQIAILGRFNSLLGKGNGACDTEGRQVSTGMYQKVWEPEYISDKLKYCWTELEGKFWIWGTKKGVDKADLTSTDFLVFIEELLADALIETYLRVAWFNDKDAELVDDGGVITDGTDLAFFNRIDGFWKQLFAIGTSNPVRKTAGLTVKNAAASYALQEFNSTDTTNKVVSKTLQNMRFGSDSRLRGKQNLVYTVTQSVADQYERELIEYNVAYTTDRLENGVAVLKTGGITVISFEFWDRIIREFFDNGTTFHLPHRALLSVPENVQLGTEEEGTLTGYKVWYSDDTDNVFVKFGFNIDAKVIVNHEVQLAY